ncbi:hypothetical protein BOX15_Mlig014922g2, partial [Macrostomum lignano]
SRCCNNKKNTTRDLQRRFVRHSRFFLCSVAWPRSLRILPVSMLQLPSFDQQRSSFKAAELQLAAALRSLRELRLERPVGPAAASEVDQPAARSLQVTRTRICGRVSCLHLAQSDIRAQIEPATSSNCVGKLNFESGNCTSHHELEPSHRKEAFSPTVIRAADGVKTSVPGRCSSAAANDPPEPRLRTACGRSASAAMSAGAGDGAESARRSLTLSLALAEQFAHVDSSSEEEAEETAAMPVSNGACEQGCPAAVAGAADQLEDQHQHQHQYQNQHQNQHQHQHQHQHQNQHQNQHQHQHQHQQSEIHQCRSWDSGTQQHQLARRVAPHERLIIENQRRKVCEEIVETERKYCSCLWTLIDLIGGSLRAAAFISTRDLCLIFPNTLPRLYDIHAAFLGSLEESDDCSVQRQPPLPQCSLAQAVQQFLQRHERRLLQLYRSYVAQFGAAMRCVRRLRRRSRKFRDLLLSLQRHPDCEGLELTAFLLTPVQRLPRYLLLLRQLADRTDPRHPDLGHLTRATDRLRGLLDQLNCSIQGALAEATAWPAGDSSAATAAAVDEEAAASFGDRQQQQQHFLLGAGQSSRQRRRSTQPEALAHHPWDSPRHLKRSQRRVAGQQAEQPEQQRCRSVPPEEASGSRSRVVVFEISPETARRLRPGDRSRSAGDVIASGGSAIGGGSLHQAAPGAVATSSTGAASPATALSGRGGRRRKSSPRTAVKETFRKMFLSRRKVSDSRLDSSWGDL